MAVTITTTSIIINCLDDVASGVATRGDANHVVSMIK